MQSLMPRITPSEHPVFKTLETLQHRELPMNQSVVKFIESYGQTPFAYRDIIHPTNPSTMSFLLGRIKRQLRTAFGAQIIYLCIITVIGIPSLKADFKKGALNIFKRYLRAVAFNWCANSAFWILLKLFTSGKGNLSGSMKVLVSIMISCLCVFIEDIQKLHVYLGLLGPKVL